MQCCAPGMRAGAEDERVDRNGLLMPYIDGLPLAAAVSSSDLLPIAQGGMTDRPGTAYTNQITVQELFGGLAAGGLTVNAAGFLLNGTPFGGGAGNPGGSNTQVQINGAGAFVGNSTFTFNSSTKLVGAQALAVSGGGSLAGTFSGTPTFSGLHTFSAGASIAGGALSGTFTGAPTWNGAHTFTNQASAPAITLTGNNTVLSNTNTIGWLHAQGFIAGTPSVSTNVVGIIASDVMEPTGQVPQLVNITHNLAPNGDTATGNRITFGVVQTAIGASVAGGSYTHSGINQAAQFTIFSDCNVGGTNAGSGAQGSNTTVGVTATLNTGATFYAGNAGMEIDTATCTGASTASANSLLLVQTSNHQTQAVFEDNGLLIADQVGVGAGRKVLIALGGAGAQWPLDVTQGAMIQGRLGSNYPTKPADAIYGFDALQVGFPAFNTTARGGFLTSNGFAVDGVGAVQIGTAYATPSGTGLAIDCKGIVGTGTPTIGSGGTGYLIGDIIFDPYGGIYKVTNQSGGAVTAVAPFTDGHGVARQPYYPSSTPPTNPVATTSWFQDFTPGSGCTLTLSWNTTATVLSLQPSGGTIKAGSGAFTANGSVATAMSSLGPAGSHTTVQEWLTITDPAGTVRYIPCF